MTVSSILSTRETSSSVSGVAAEEQEVVAPVGLVVDLVRELAASPDVVPVDGAAALLDQLARPRATVSACFSSESSGSSSSKIS